VVGLNEGKFFGQDSAEEGLKLLEHVANNSPEYTLLFGLSERDMGILEEDYKVVKGRLTPSREIEGKRFCEHVPIMQAGMVDKRPRRGIGRSIKTTQNHVAWQLWKKPLEAVKIYWAYWRRKHYKDAASRKFWAQHFPASSYCYFEEQAHLIAIRATEHIAASRKQGPSSSTVLAVNNEIYDLVVDRLGELIDKDAPDKLGSQDFSRNLRDNATELCADVPDLTPLLIFVYLVAPLLSAQFVYMGIAYYVKKAKILDDVLSGDEKLRE